MAEKITFHKLVSLNAWLIIVASIITLFVTFYLSKLWYDGFLNWVNMIPYFIWALLPYAIMFWLDRKYSHNFSQALIILFFIFGIILFGAITYTYSVVLEYNPNTDMVLLVIPLYQFILAVIAFPVVVIFHRMRKKR